MTAEIRAAFADVPYPGDDGIVSPSALMGNLYRAAFRGKSWSDIVDPEFLEEFPSVGEFSLEGKRYYLPAYLIAVVQHPDDAGYLLDQWIGELYPRFDLCPTEMNGFMMSEWDRLMNALTPRQKHSIRLFLEYLLAIQPDSWRAPEPPGNYLALMLANYWNQF